MENNSDIISQIRDIHLPEAPSFWPPAPGWWIVAGLLLLVYILYRWYQARTARLLPLRSFRAALRVILQDKSAPTPEVVGQISALIKRYLIELHGRAQVAALQGAQWLAYLDATTEHNNGFSNGPGKVLEYAQYQAHADTQEVNLDDLGDYLQKWAKQVANV